MSVHCCIGSPCFICHPVMVAPQNGFVMPPVHKSWEQIASIICGHDLVQTMSEDHQAEFESFIREVLRSQRFDRDTGGVRS